MDGTGDPGRWAALALLASWCRQKLQIARLQWSCACSQGTVLPQGVMPAEENAVNPKAFSKPGLLNTQ